MEFRSVKGYTGAAQLGFLLVFIGVGLVLAGNLLMLITKQKDPISLQLAQVTGTFCLFFLPAVIFSRIVNGKSLFWLGFNRHVNLYQVLLGFLIIFTANVMAAPLQDLTKALLVQMPSIDSIARQMELAYNEQVKLLTNLKGVGDFLIALVVVAFFPALFEEVLFRGAMQTLFVKWWRLPLLAIVVTSLLFSLTHGSIYLFMTRFALGLVLGYMYHVTRNIWVNIIAHFLNNALALAQLFTANAKNKAPGASFESQLEWWYGVIAAGIVFFLFRFLVRYSEKNVPRIIVKEQVLRAKETAPPFTKVENQEFGDQ